MTSFININLEKINKKISEYNFLAGEVVFESDEIQLRLILLTCFLFTRRRVLTANRSRNLKTEKKKKKQFKVRTHFTKIKIKK